MNQLLKIELLYVRKDGSINLAAGEEEYELLFPRLLLDEDWRSIIDGETAWHQGEERKLYLGESQDFDIKKFILAFYEKSALYEVIGDIGDKVYVRFCQQSLEKNELNPQEWRRLDSVYKGEFIVHFEDDKKTISISLCE